MIPCFSQQTHPALLYMVCSVVAGNARATKTRKFVQATTQKQRDNQFVHPITSCRTTDGRQKTVSHHKTNPNTHIPPKVEPQRKTPTIEATPETTAKTQSSARNPYEAPVNIPLMRKLPFPVHNPERNILIWRPCTELQDDRIVISRLLNDLVGRSFRLVDKIREEDVKLRFINQC